MKSIKKTNSSEQALTQNRPDFTRCFPEPCTRCGSQNTEIIRVSPPHYQKEVCCGCGKTIRFVPKPANVERRRRIEHALRTVPDSAFVKSLRAQYMRSGKLSPKQIACLMNIFEKGGK